MQLKRNHKIQNILDVENITEKRLINKLCIVLHANSKISGNAYKINGNVSNYFLKPRSQCNVEVIYKFCEQ
jgi:hypothetical protein